jgi:hypothetical protein
VKDRQDSSYADDWLMVARRDWHRIHVMLVDGDADGAGFFLQQALESTSRPSYFSEAGN